MHRLKLKEKILKFFIIGISFLLALAFVIKFSGPAILRLYVQSGIGDCQKMPILCMAPKDLIINPRIDNEYLSQLLPYDDFPKVSISAPRGFTIVQERITKVYYKKKKRNDKGDIIYLLHQEPDFFINLFPQVKSDGIKDNYEFMKRIMYAKLIEIKNISDTFFVIMKGIFTPDLGEQKNVKMAEFIFSHKKGFINYNTIDASHYFDCNIIDSNGDIFKVYIKDKTASLDLDKVLAIISTVRTRP